MSRISDRKLLNGPRAGLTQLVQAVEGDLIDPITTELVKVHASQINGCGPCLTSHWKAALGNGERVDRLASLTAWREADWFTDREKAALEWTEAVTNTATDHIRDETWEAVSQHFNEEEMVELTMTIISINSLNRFNIAFRNQPTRFKVPE